MTRQEIIDKTHYGVNIYAYILRQYAPGTTVLSLHGRACSPANNPFRENKTSLMVTIVNGLACHTDTNDPTFTGDAFDFAQLHYKLEGELLLSALDETMHLGIEKPTGLYQESQTKRKPQREEENINTPHFSFFKRPISNTIPKGIVSIVELYQLIKGSSYAEATKHLRQIEDPKEARAYKAKHFDYATLSGRFSRRSDKAITAHSGLMTIDFDHLEDVTTLKAKLLEDEYFETELLFTSPSGDGLKWIVPIDLTVDSHTNYFKAIANYIKQTYHVEIDNSGKDVSRACFIPHDKDVYINPKYLSYGN